MTLQKPQVGDPMPWVDHETRVTPDPRVSVRESSGDLPEVLYHYTTLKGMNGILSKGTIWATDLRYLNDTSEFKLAITQLQGLLRSVARSIQNQSVLAGLDLTLQSLCHPENHCVFVSSFSTRRDSLSQWRAYCNPGGYSMGFESSRLTALGVGVLARCLYSEDEQLGLARRILKGYVSFFDPYVKKFPQHREVAIANIHKFLKEDLLFLAPMIKHSSFEDEREWRFIASPTAISNRILYRRGLSELIPYIEIPWRTEEGPAMKEIVVGPMPNQESAELSLRQFLSCSENKDCRVSCSDTPYRNW